MQLLLKLLVISGQFSNSSLVKLELMLQANVLVGKRINSGLLLGEKSLKLLDLLILVSEYV